MLPQQSHNLSTLNISPVQDLINMIKIQSINPPGQEKEMSEYLIKRLSGLGAEVEVQEVMPGRENVIGRWKLGDSEKGPSIVFTTHMDVVPTSPGREDQFEPRLLKDRVYGRGSCDAKGSLAGMLAACNLLAAEKGICGTLIFAGVVGEESGGIGTRALLKAMVLKPDAVIVGEPTGLKVANGHRGIWRGKCFFKGTASHPAGSSGGNPIHAAGKLIEKVSEMNDRLKNITVPGFGCPSIGVNFIRGGLKDNILPSLCEISIERRLCPGEDQAATETDIREVINLVQAQSSQIEIDLEVNSYNRSAVAMDTTHFLVSAAVESTLAVTGGQEVAGFRAASDQGLFIEAGIPAITLGPGHLLQAHSDDEYLELAELERSIMVYLYLGKKLLAPVPGV